MTHDQAAVITHLRRLSSQGERSCRWCRREMMGDHAELVHVLCAPDVDQVELFRADAARIEQLRWLCHAFLGLALSPFLIAAARDGLDGKDGLLGVELIVLLALQRYFWLQQIRLTRGLWRKSREWMKEKHS